MMLAIVTGCSIIADPWVQRDWDYDCFNDFQTFANTPLAEGGKSEPASATVAGPRCLPLPRERDRLQTIANAPLAGRGKAATASPEFASPRAKVSLVPQTVASSRVLWNVNTECRDKYPKQDNGKPPARAEVLKKCSPPNPNWPEDKNLIALGISGGGTKSAVFATEAIFALKQWGLLDELDMISSVSGGSFAAALYAVSCDPPFCDESENARLRWEQKVISDRADANLIPWQVLERLLPWLDPRITQGHRTSNHVLAESIDWRILSRPDQEGDLMASTSGFLNRFQLGPDETHRLEFRDLNPRRPNLVLNAANVSSDRQFLEAEAGVPPEERRLIDKADWTHFAFTDYYFETLLHSDLSQYPVANAVAASAAFPAIIDYATIGRFNRPGSYGNTRGIDFVHLTDAGVQDNHGLTEIRLALEDIFGRSGSPAASGPKPKRVLAVVLDASLIDLNGVSRNHPHPLGLDTLVSPLRPFIIDQATSILLATNAAQHDARMREYLKRQVERECDDTKGPGQSNSVCAEIARIGFERMDGYDSVLVGDNFFDCDAPEAIKYLNVDPTTVSEAERKRREDKRRQCEVMKKLRTPGTQERLGLGSYHPQCYVEATRSAETSYSIEDDTAICLRHAARWAVAMKMLELCADPRFGGGPDMLDGADKKLPIGIHCSMPANSLPPLPRECPYFKIVNVRPWLEMSRQTAHCTCSDRYNCQPEDLLTGRPMDTGGRSTTRLADEVFRASVP